MANEGNLQPVKTKSEARIRGRNGGIASGKARRAAKVYSDAAKAIMASRFNTACADKELREMCDAFGFGDVETGAIMLALSDFLRGIKHGDKESIERLLNAAGISVQNAGQTESFESPNIYVLPSLKEGEELILAEEAVDDESS